MRTGLEDLTVFAALQAPYMSLEAGKANAEKARGIAGPESVNGAIMVGVKGGSNKKVKAKEMFQKDSGVKRPAATQTCLVISRLACPVPSMEVACSAGSACIAMRRPTVWESARRQWMHP